MNVDAFLKRRPFAYHTTAAHNFDRIHRARTIESARRLFELAGGTEDPGLRERRKQPLQLDIDGQKVWIRDQQPLVPGAIAFEPGWDLPRFVEHLNGFAFFWPGDEAGPIAYGRNHFKRYAGAGEALVVLRMSTRALFVHNHERRILFSRVNSGATRMNQGKKAPRGETTFRAAELFTSRPSEVKEIVIEGVASLPARFEVASDLSGPWQPA